MIEIEVFFTTYKNTALAFYSFAGFIGVVTAVVFRLRAMYKNRIEQAQEEAKLSQRHEFQAEYFDLQERRQTWIIQQIIKINKSLDSKL